MRRRYLSAIRYPLSARAGLASQPVSSLLLSFSRSQTPNVSLIMDIQINETALSLPEQSTLADALSLFGARPPFAVAVNGEFVARGQHTVRTLQAGDKVDVVHPVAGG